MLLVCTQNSGKQEEFRALFEPKRKVIGLARLLQRCSISSFDPKENADSFLANAAIKILSVLSLIETHFNADPNFFSQIKYILADDSGLCVPGFQFLPGVHSAYFSGLPRSDKRNNEKLSHEVAFSPLSYLYKEEKRLPAFFVCFLLSCDLEKMRELFTGKTFARFQEAKSLLSNSTIMTLERRIFHSIVQAQQSGCSQAVLDLEIVNKVNFQLSYGYCLGEVSTQSQNLILNAGHGYDPLFYPQEKRDTSFASMTLSEKNKISHRAHAFTAALNAF